MPTSAALVKFSDGEDDFLASLLKERKQDLSIAIPDDMEPREVLAAVGRCASVLVKLERGASYIVPVLGKLMARVAADRLWEMAGSDSLEHFEVEHLRDKISHGALWAAKKIYEVYPGLPLEQYAAIGTNKLKIAAQVCGKLGASERQKKEMLTLAEQTNSVDEFRVEAEKKLGPGAEGDTKAAYFELIGTGAEVAELKEHLAEPRFHEFAQDDRPIGCVLAAIQESSDLWPREASGTANVKPKAQAPTPEVTEW